MNAKNTYHLGLIKGSGKCKCWRNYHAKNTIVLQARRSIDNLSCELWEYIGERITTKTQLNANKSHILVWINGYYHTNFTHIVID
jgi:hypothetical protein